MVVNLTITKGLERLINKHQMEVKLHLVKIFAANSGFIIEILTIGLAAL